MEWTDPNVRSPSTTGASSDSVRRPSAVSASIRLEVYAAFELQHMLGTGEQLRGLTVTVEQLLDRSEKDIREWDGILYKGLSTHIMKAFMFFPKEGDVVSPCSSIFVTIERRKTDNSNSTALRVLGPHWVSRRLVSTRSSLIRMYQ